MKWNGALISVALFLMTQIYTTYQSLVQRDPIEHFAKEKSLPVRVVRSHIVLCDILGYSRTIEILNGATGDKSSFSYRELQYMHKTVKAHATILLALKKSKATKAYLSEDFFISRMEGSFDELIEEINGERKIRGSYRDLILKRG